MKRTVCEKETERKTGGERLASNNLITLRTRERRTDLEEKNRN